MFAGILVIYNKCDAVLMECLPVIKPFKTTGGSDLHLAHSYLNPECLLEINYYLRCGQCCGTVPVMIYCDSGSDVGKLSVLVPNQKPDSDHMYLAFLYKTCLFFVRSIIVLQIVVISILRNGTGMLYGFRFRSCGSGLGSLIPGLWG